jgi:hypothetical protein
MRVPIPVAIAAMMAFSLPASADPWKDESGKGGWRGGYERYDDPMAEAGEKSGNRNSAPLTAARWSASGRRANTKKK